MNAASEAKPHPISASSYYLWEAAGKSVSVRLNLDVIDRLCSDVNSKFTDLTGRGSEIGGILLGRMTNASKRTFFIEDYELIACDYNDGPLFSLSDEAKSRMVEQLLRLKTSSGHSILGFFRSHTRKNLSLTEHDLSLIRDYFAGPETVFLLIKPFATKPSLAGFFIWEDGEIQTEQSYCQFRFKRAELVVRTPDAIVGPDLEFAESGPAHDTGPRATGTALLRREPPEKVIPDLLPLADDDAAPPADAPVRAPRTSVGVQNSLDQIMRQINCDPSEKRLFSAGMDLDAERERWSRFALERSIVSQQRTSKVDPVPDRSPSPAAEEARWNNQEDLQTRASFRLRQERRAARVAGQKSSEWTDHSTDTDELKYCPPVVSSADASFVWFRWICVSLFVLFLLGGAYVVTRVARSSGEPDAKNELNFAVERDGGALVLHWNPESGLIATAKNAILRIEDNNQSKNFDLDLEQLRFGKIVYFPSSGDVNFRLEVIDAGGSRSVSEWARSSPKTAERKSEPTASPTSSLAHGPGSRESLRSKPADMGSDAGSANAEGEAVPAKLIHSTPPEYPEAARTAHVSGVVGVEAVVGRDGKIKSAVAASGPALLREAAVNAVRGFLYEPATHNGEPVESPTRVNVKFIWK